MPEGVQDVQTRLREAQERKLEREKGYDGERAEQQLAELELEEKYVAEMGRRGRDFEIVNPSQTGPIVLRRGEDVLYKRFQAAMQKDKLTPEDVHAYVAPCVVHPSKEAFNALLGKWPHIGMRCANALLSLHGFKEEDDRGKF